jgi:cytoskeletal protein CcmA (bactofilin family)
MIKMEFSKIPTTKISGSGRITLPGFGEFKVSGSGRLSSEEISTSGSSRIPGGLVIGDLKSSGSTRINGDLTVEMVKFSGSARIEGNLTCDEILKSGSLRVEKSLKIKYGRFSGSTNIGGSGTVERELEASGTIAFGGDLISHDRILYSGLMRVDGSLKAQSFEARLSRDESYIKDGIEADYINIQRSHEDWRNRGRFITMDITGDEIILENVECDNITGRKITILPGCRIKGNVKYSESIKVDKDSVLKNEPEQTE